MGQLRGHQALNQVQTTRLSLSLAMQQSLHVLQASSRELFKLVDQVAKKNPCIKIVPRDWQAGSSENFVEALEGKGPSLFEHVTRQISLVLSAASDRMIAEHFVMALSETGWIDSDIETIARRAGCTVVRALTVLQALQTIEPTGLFARSLAECLRLQAVDVGKCDDTMEVVLRDLQRLAELGVDGFALRFGLEPADVEDCLGIIRGFNPKPGLEFSYVPEPIIPPELIVGQEGGDWFVRLNDEAFPDIHIKPATAGTGLDAKALRDHLNKAQSFGQALERRKATLLAIGEQVVRTQIGFLENGDIAMEPLTMGEVAEQLGVHVSTVSRAVNSCLIQIPSGTILLRRFFSRAVNVSGDAEASHQGVVELVRLIIDNEEQSRPLSDEQIRKQLVELGFSVTTRSVNNHRRSLGIPRAGLRKSPMPECYREL